MKMIKSELFLCMTLTAFVFVCALAWGSPFVAIGSASATTAHAQKQFQMAVFTGTVQREGQQFLLRDSSGQTFRLDNAQSAQRLEGKDVTITGTLDAQNQMIHVVRIEFQAA